ncbi:MAG: 30S ribosomal protein S13 [Candidatus Heimdallarchaeota archaeon]
MSQEFKDFQHLVRISSTDIKGDKQAVNGLTYIRGVGSRLADVVLKKAGIPHDAFIGMLTDEQIKKINEIIADPISFGIPVWFVNHVKDRVSGKNIHLVGNDLALYDRNDVDRLKKLRTYRGIKHHAGHKVRGQRTKSTGRGGRSLGVSRRKLEK